MAAVLSLDGNLSRGGTTQEFPEMHMDRFSYL